ncbi:girdin [Eucyclogobius newberryi]|uniref:girdin n=1 Tax=Eucyclogobius newberryi TaxID=166745 RepID=UPI003B5A5B74
MESGGFRPCLDQFMASPLVTWVKTFMTEDQTMSFDFAVLLDGMFLNDIMNQISASTTPQDMAKVNRIHNLSLLVQQIKTHYQDHLKQLIMTPLPNVLLLIKTPYCEQALQEMKKLLLLLLGCAVQCENKEDYIERIQKLEFDTKAAIAAHIQELTHSQENVLDLLWLEVREGQPELEFIARKMALHIRSLLNERDTYFEIITELMQDWDSGWSPQSCPQSTIEQQQRGAQQHLSVELADSKAKIRRLRQELEEKSEQMLDCRHELENIATEMKRIQQENSQLLVDARTARTYRDELDSMRERAIRADKLESEVGRYRDQLHKMDFYKAKVEELKEDNRVLQETKEVLEEQLEGWRSRSDQIHQLEKQCLLLNARVHDLEQEKEVDQKRIEDLQEENLGLYMAQRRSMEESQHLGWELEQLSMTENCRGPLSLGEEVSENTHSRMLKLEKENQSLLRTIEELRAVTRSNEVTKGLQSPNVHSINHMKRSTQETWNGEENYSEVHPVTLEQVQTKIFFTEGTGFLTQEKRLMENEVGGMHSVEVHENCQSPLLCVEPESVHTSGSKYSSPSHASSIFTALPTHSSFASKHTQRLEAKCRNLDIVNQHLQTALDNTDQKFQRLEAEVQELEAENISLQATLEELRISLRRLEQLETEKSSLEQENTVLEREKRQLEKENRRLRQQVEIQDANLDRSNVCIASLEKESRFHIKELENLKETAERVKSTERENRELSKQSAIDQRTLATLREELVSEKLKNQQKDNDLERLTRELEMNDAQEEEQDALDTKFHMLESELELSLKKSLQIKEEKMEALEARLQESSTLNLQLRQELKTVKLRYEALQQRLDEESTLSSTSPQETSKAMSEWLRESQETTKELLKLKDRLIKVERNNATLEAERQGMQARLKQLDTQSNSQQSQILALQRQASVLQENHTALQTNNAKLQVEKSTLKSQGASLLAQNAQLQQQQQRTESERDAAIHEREELRSVHEQLLRDHERLAALHERQAMEYEALMGKHGCLKKAHRTLELENRTLQDRYNTLVLQRNKLEELEKTVKEEQVKISMEKEQHRTTAAECCRLRDEKDWLNQTYRQLLSDNELLTYEHKEVKGQLNEAKLEHTWLQADFSKLKKEFQELDISSTKLNNRCELLGQLKGNLEEENRHLLNQIETLMLQNRTLLEQTMESKDLFHVEERQYIDKLNDLRRQKEKLEEKIMDQYKFYEPSTPRRRGNWITLKLRKLIKSSSRDSGSEQPPSPTHPGTDPHLLCHDNSSFLDGASSSPAGHMMLPRCSSTSLKMFPRLKKKLKDKDKAKSIFRRSMSLSSLVHPSATLRDERWSGSTRMLDRSDTEINAEDTLTSSFTTSTLSIFKLHSTKSETLHPSIHHSETALDVCDLWVTDKESNDSAVPSGVEDNEELPNHDANGTQSRAQSESSGEFSVSLDNQPWSSGSSPVQHPQPHQSSISIQPPTDASTPHHGHLRKSSDVTPKDKKTDLGPAQDFWLTRGKRSLRRGSKNKFTRCLSDATDSDKTNQEERETDSKSASENTVTTRVVACSPITVLYVQGKSSSMSGCLNCFSAPLGKEGKLRGTKSTKSLPRASGVLSKAQGSSRRSSDSSDCRVKLDSLPVQVSESTTEQDKASLTRHLDVDVHNCEPVPPVKPPRDPAAVPTDRPKSPVQESAFGSAFTFKSVFSNTIFSDSVIQTDMERSESKQTFIELTQALMENGPGQMYVCNSTQQTLLSVEGAGDQSVESTQKH